MPPAEIYIELVVRFPEDPKVRSLLRYGADARGLRDLYVQMALYCKRNLSDGYVPEEEIGILVYPDTWENGQRDADRLVSAKLLERVEGGYIVSAYVKRNRTKAEVLKLTEDKASGGTYGNHVRWHANQGKRQRNCPHCQSDVDRSTDRISDQGSDRTAESGSESHSESHDPGSGPTEDTDPPDGADVTPASDAAAEHSSTSSGDDALPGIGPELGNLDSSHTDRTTDHMGNRVRSPETETETETEEKNPPTPQGGKRRKRRAGPEDYDTDPDFIRFWDAYPEKRGKVDAFKAWQSAVARGDNPELIIQAAEWFRDDPTRNPEHTKWAQGWLNGRRYKEQKPTRQRSFDEFWEN